MTRDCKDVLYETANEACADCVDRVSCALEADRTRNTSVSVEFTPLALDESSVLTKNYTLAQELGFGINRGGGGVRKTGGSPTPRSPSSRPIEGRMRVTRLGTFRPNSTGAYMQSLMIERPYGKHELYDLIERHFSISRANATMRVCETLVKMKQLGILEDQTS